MLTHLLRSAIPLGTAQTVNSSRLFLSSLRQAAYVAKASISTTDSTKASKKSAKNSDEHKDGATTTSGSKARSGIGNRGGENMPFDILKIINLLPQQAGRALMSHEQLSDLIEVVMDLGRIPVARFPSGDVKLSSEPIGWIHLRDTENKVGRFNKDNRAGISGTLHRISCIRNAVGSIVGLTCRVGRDIPESGRLVEDILQDGKSILMLGAPGVGKTTAIRCMARYLSDVMKKRVIVVDTSNEIAGDGDIPHKSIGSARRMQVPDKMHQREVMIEAIQNHTPEVLIIDEIGSSDESDAARIVCRRGVQLIASAHGKTLRNVVHDPAMRDLFGGLQTVVYSDAWASTGNFPKVAQERKFEPSFDVVVEMEERGKWKILDRLPETVDLILREEEGKPEVRYAPSQQQSDKSSSKPSEGSGEQTASLFGGGLWQTSTSGEALQSWQSRRWFEQVSIQGEDPAVSSIWINHFARGFKKRGQAAASWMQQPKNLAHQIIDGAVKKVVTRSLGLSPEDRPLMESASTVKKPELESASTLKNDQHKKVSSESAQSKASTQNVQPKTSHPDYKRIQPDMSPIVTQNADDFKLSPVDRPIMDTASTIVKEDPAPVPAPKKDQPKVPAPKKDQPKVPAPKKDQPKVPAPKKDQPKVPAPKKDQPKASPVAIQNAKAKDPEATKQKKSQASTTVSPLAEIKRILTASSNKQILQVNRNMTIEDVREQFKTLNATALEVKDAEGSKARRKLLEAYTHYLRNQTTYWEDLDH